MAEVKHLDESNFEELTGKGVALLDFWAEWCGPCRMLGPILEDLAEELGDSAVIAKVDVEKNPKLAAKYQVRSIPAVFILKDGETVNNFVGVQDKQTLLKAVKNA